MFTEGKKAQMKYLAIILLIVLFFIKILVTGYHHWAIVDAIYVHNMECIEERREGRISYDAAEPFSDTLWRLWDWSGKRILDEETYRIVKPYIGKLSSADFAGQYFEEG